MATVFRATVMLVTLVGLPAAWVYYGPLPTPVMGVIERTVLAAKQSCGWGNCQLTDPWETAQQKTAPRYDTASDPAMDDALLLAQQAAVEQSAAPMPTMRHDGQLALASANLPQATMSVPLQGESALANQLDPHLSLLRSLGAANYTLENWGGSGELFRFRCSIALGQNEDHTRHFEAVGADPLQAVHQVVGEVTSWQNARRANSPTQWR